MSMLERADAEAYARALGEEADPAIRAVLAFISADSEKHARVLEALASGAACRRDECYGLMGIARRRLRPWPRPPLRISAPSTPCR